MAKAKAIKRGRKSLGHKPREVFSVRLDPVVREQLEASARERGKNVSHEINRLLKDALAFERKESDERMRAVSYLMGEVAKFVGEDWATNPWLFSAFKAGVNMLLHKIAPKGEMVRPGSVDEFEEKTRPDDDFLADMRSTPQKYGNFAGFFIWRSLLNAHPIDGVSIPRGSHFLTMPQARAALGITHEVDPALDRIARAVYNQAEDDQ